MTHAAMDPEARQRAGLSDGLVRLSVGIEDSDDLCEALQNALQAVLIYQQSARETANVRA
jgi:cystathionine gamma-synthase